MINKKAAATEQQIAEHEKLLQQRLKDLAIMISDIEKLRKSQKNIILAAKKDNEIKDRVKKLLAEKELAKYSLYAKYGYLHNLSMTLGLIDQFEDFMEELKEKDALRRKYSIEGEELDFGIYDTGYSKDQLKEIAKLAEEQGSYLVIAKYLGISESHLFTKRKQNPKLDFLLKEAVLKHAAKNNINANYQFSETELAEITEIVRKDNIEAASKRFGLRADAFFELRKKNKPLAAAIKNGQLLRKNDTPFNHAIELFSTFDSIQLQEIKEIAVAGGLEAVVNKYGFSRYVLIKCRKELPELETAIKAGLKQRPIGAAISGALKEKKEGKVPKPYKRKDEFKKPPREIINTTMLAIEENTADAWANFRKIVEDRKAKANLKKVSTGYYNDIIGI